MAQDEKHGTRSLAYSAWHRMGSTKRFVAEEDARLLSQIDIDHVLWMEYDDKTKEPILLIEEAQDTGQDNKPSTVTRNMARRMHVYALVVLWKPASVPNPANEEWPDIESFRVKRIWPPSNKPGWHTVTPKKYAEKLLKLRKCQGEIADNLLFDIPA